MEPKVEDKSVVPAPAAGTDKDERGVSWENRAKEYERKLKDLEAKVNSIPKPPEAPVVPEDKQKRLMEFVEDPEGYMDRHYQQRKFQEELPVAEDWLSKQPHFTNWDDVKTLIKEHGLGGVSPSRTARTVSELLKTRALEREFENGKRETKVNKSSPDGGSRTAPVDNKITRSDLIKQLRKAEGSGNMQEAARILSQLEDVRG